MQDLHELLQAGRTGGPPPRYDADHVIATGRRRLARRRIALAGVAVAVVAASVAVPLTISRPDNTPTIAATPEKKPLSYPAEPFTYSFRGYEAAQFDVQDPSVVTADYQQADVRVRGVEETVKMGSGHAAPSVTRPRTALKLVVYRPGKFDPAVYVKFDADVVDVGGRTAYFSPHLPIDGEPKPGDPVKWSSLVWQYADDAWAAVYNVTPPDTYGLGDLLAVAEGLTGSEPYPATALVRPTYLPAGYRLSSGGRGADFPYGADASQHTGLRYVHSTPGGPGPGPVTNPVQFPGRELRISVYDVEWIFPDARRPTCAPKLCQKLLSGGRLMVEVTGAAGTEDLQRILDGLRVADPDEPGSWFVLGDL